ncbi:hypothetical protein [Nocardia sp. NPDC059239]
MNNHDHLEARCPGGNRRVEWTSDPIGYGLVSSNPQRWLVG